MDIFFEIHKDIPREGPGDNQSTKKAYEILKEIPSNPNILDIGCGPGMQTIELAKHTDGNIYALDTQKQFLDRLNENAQENKVNHKIKTIQGSMFNLGEYFEENELDLIWSEEAIFIIGFEEGLKKWKPFLKKDGYLVVSEVSWIEENIPKEIKDFWESDYPSIHHIEGNIELVKKCGYKLIDKFIIPESSWWDHYYIHLEKRISILREIHSDEDEWISRLDNTQKEIEMYRKYSKYYGYVFYIMQR
ncbi:methyltransferase type 11 [Paraliobacillus quinghaiensis]|uniref:Methyltransferase type 11 n=1 Tax=Paraliobacillus quinghaiensis TaxID=470815 RepID=A0A917WX34_9BACI|nr:class I SAM-dependent methyltransferase [Paraliobacillus quinghaiensis]GGM41076.1 methyltransferase type 11 [Paraliobacillus quinghaiensis]